MQIISAPEDWALLIIYIVNPYDFVNRKQRINFFNQTFSFSKC
jgi:hypothetical protein